MLLVARDAGASCGMLECILESLNISFERPLVAWQVMHFAFAEEDERAALFPVVHGILLSARERSIGAVANVSVNSTPHRRANMSM